MTQTQTHLIAARPLCAAALLLSALLTACGDSDDSSADSRGLSGIFEVTSHTLNTTSCDAPGDPLPPEMASPFLLIHRHTSGTNLYNVPFIQAYQCDTLDACRAFQAQQTGGSFELSGHILDRGDDNIGWGGGRSSALPVLGECTGSSQSLSLIGSSGFSDGRLRVTFKREEQQLRFPVRDGQCTQSDLNTANAQTPCTRLEVIEATFVE